MALVLTACDLQPPPPRAAPAPAAPVALQQKIPEPIPAAGSTRPPPADNTAPAGPTGANQPCLDVSVHIANLVIASAPDPAQRSALEQDRAMLVRRSAETCTRDSWTDATRTCFLDATTVEAMQVCGKDLKAP